MAPTLIHNFATTPAGEKLSYYTIGSGPSLLILHGAVTYALSFSELAEALSPWFTVHTASRPGRGLSEGFPAAVTDNAPVVSTSTEKEKPATLTVGAKSYKRTYSPEFTSAVLEAELVALDTLIAATEPQFIIGVSSGALVMLQGLIQKPSVSRQLASVKKIIIFEPPLYCSDKDSTGDLTPLNRFEEEIARGDTVAALTTAVTIVQLAPGWIPRWLMKFLTSLMMGAQEKDRMKKMAAGEEDKGASTMASLAPLLRYDFAVAEGMIGPSDRFREVKDAGPEIMLLSGAKTPSYLRHAMDVLTAVIDGATTVIIDGIGHELLCNKEMQGRPEKAVETIRDFFK